MDKPNNKPNITVVFSDLEGTLLDEEFGKLDAKEFRTLVKNFDVFSKKTNTQIIFVIVSPVEQEFMAPLLEQIEDEFFKFNSENGTTYKIELAACYKPHKQDEYSNNMANNILPMLDHNAGKRRVVDWLTDSLGYRFNIQNTIYMGNGANDIDAINFLQGKYKDHSYTICPLNSKSRLRTNRRCVIGNGVDIHGINDGFSQVLSSLEQSTNISTKIAHDNDDVQSL